MTGIIEVYHAGVEEIPHPDTVHSRPQLDFGTGFYVTDIYEQAVNWALRQGQRQNRQPVINKYLLKKADLLKCASTKAIIFEEYDERWLDFIVGNRRGQGLWHGYNYIEGGVADDRVIDTIDLYMTGFINRETAIERLKYLRPNNQICLTDQQLIDKFLTFIDCIQIDLP